MLRTITFNARSLRQPEVIELIIDYMRAHGIHCAALQETWLPGSLVEQNKGFTIVRHNADQKAGERGGVAIVLDARATSAWDRAGNAVRHFTNRIVAVKLRFVAADGTCNTVCFISAYAPTSAHADAEHDVFHDALADAVDWAAPTDILVLGGDFNASLGIRTKDDVANDVPNAATPAVGPYGIRHVNAAGRRLRAFAEMQGLRDCTSFFKNQKRRGAHSRATRHDDSRYRTWVHPRSRKPYQLDHIFVNQTQARRVQTAHVVRDTTARMGGSDHRPVRADIRLGKGSLRAPEKRPPRPQRGMLSDPDARAAFLDAVRDIAAEEDTDMLFDSFDAFNAAINRAAPNTLVGPARKTPSWMGEARPSILAAARARNAAMARVECGLANSKHLRRARAKLSTARKKLRKLVDAAKAAWVNEIVDTRVRFVGNGGGPLNAREIWAGIDALKQGPTDMRLKTATPLYKPDGKTLTKDDDEKCEVFHDNFEKQLNQPESFDPTVLEEIKQFPTLHELDEPPSAEEVRKVFSRAKNGKADGPIGIAAEHWKAIMGDPELFECVVQLVQILFDQRVVPKDWIISNLNPVPKKGDLRYVTNWRPIMLRDAAAKAVTLIFGLRIAKVFKLNGRESQCGFCGDKSTLDGIFNSKSIVQLRREAGLPTWALWVDLRKAFDTVSRRAMVLVLKRYGVPPKLCAIFEALYAKAVVHLHVGTAESSFDSTMGVFQGCPAAPTLFNFMVDAWFQAIQPRLQQHMLKFRTCDTTAAYGTSGRASNLRGRSIGDNTTGTPFETLESLYADDAGCFVCSRSVMQAMGVVLLVEGKRWGMIIHTATTEEIAKGEGSKTEFTYFPVAPHHPDADGLADEADVSPIELAPGKWVTEAKVKVDGRKILGFKYLGAVLTPCLRDDVEMRLRITAASKAFGALRSVFKCASLSDRCKGTIFIAFVTSLLFYGCECWSTRCDIMQEVSVFFNTCVRRICRVGKVRMWRCHIRLDNLYKRLGIRSCVSYIEERTLRWLGHNARMQEERLPRLLLFGWSPRPDGARAGGAPQKTMAIRAHDLLRRVGECTAVPEDLRERIARTFVPPPITRRELEAATARDAGRNPYGTGCMAQRRATGIQCRNERRDRFLTCEVCALNRAHFGAYKPDSDGGVAFEPQCSAAIARSSVGNTNRQCTRERRPGYLTCARHARQPALFDAGGERGAELERGWVGVAAGPPDADDDARATARVEWKTVITAFCGIPPKKKREKKGVWTQQGDDERYGPQPTPSVAARNATPDEVYTDGSSLNNGKPNAAAGVGVFFDPDHVDNISQPLTDEEPQTNNRAELTAIFFTLRKREPALRSGLRVQLIGTDSAYAIGCFGKAGRKCRHRGWKNCKNKDAANTDLIKLALEWRQTYGTHFEFVHIYAHTGAQDKRSVGNHNADRLAVAGAKQKGVIKPTFRVVSPDAPAGSELHADAPTQAYELFSQFDL